MENIEYSICYMFSLVRQGGNKVLLTMFARQNFPSWG